MLDFSTLAGSFALTPRRVDFVVMPLLMLGFFALQLDRGNIGNALTDFFFRDVGITQNQFNVGQQLLSLGIVLFEIPSNMVLYRVGPAIWIGLQIVAWGLVATFQAWQKGVGAFMATRFLLGTFESGFIPAGLYTITRWYTQKETSKRFSWYFVGNMFAGATSGLIAYGILHMRGIRGLAGWQWLFIIEGMFTIVVGIVFIALFPRSTSNPVSLLGYRFITERESQILTARVLRDDPSKAHAKTHVSRTELKNALTNWKLIPHVILTIAGLAPVAVLGSYGPSIIVGFGFGRLRSNAMSSIGAWILLFINLLWGFLADRWGRRGPLVFLGILFYVSFMIANRVLVGNPNGDLKFAFLTLAFAFSAPWHPVNGSWMALNAQSAGERSITMAILIMSANTSGIVGSQLFQQQDAPLYRTGWSAIIALVTIALTAAGIANFQYWALNRKLRRRGEGEAKYKL
ncbi:alternative sulfate transporter [Plectosphaerella plurivora]|uniref:Alternative sulfate transporter n=1 Tax=Plectosphaerella plurivora TaxID=936078 RepID=A0A9P8V6Y5_9PEZI|nr:alternative sulfate transporter [Plectosphaerella plurivora]